MSLNLDELRTEMLSYLETQGFIVFHGYSRLADTDSFVAWDTDRKPDYHQFLEVAKNAGIKLIVYHWREFTRAHIEQAEGHLEECELSSEERRVLERRLRELRAYEGFTCALELSFEFEARVYLFNLRAEWYEEYLNLLEEIDGFLPEDEDEDDSMGGGYFSRN
jgi:hypothetical protein